MAKREQLSNGAVSVITAAMTNVQTTLTVASTTGFPTDGNFRVLVDSELMLVTAVSGSTFTVVRGIESTSAVSHEAGVAILQIFTAAALERVMLDNIPLFGATERPIIGSLTDLAGNTLTSSSFTVYNQNGATITDLSDGSIQVEHITNSAVQLSLTPPAAPFTYTAGIVTDINWQNGSVGLGFRQSSNNRGSTVYQISPASGTGSGPRLDTVSVIETSAPSTFNSFILAPTRFTCARWPNPNWFRVSYVGTTMTFMYSPDGVNFTTLGSKTNSYFTPNRVHFWLNPFSAGTRPAYAKLVHWSQS